jgi:superfamily I DNA and/or RNA helicase
LDTRLAEIALNRQKNALDAIRYDRAVRSDLRELLVNPEAIETPHLESEIQWIQKLNESQQEAVKAALSTSNFLVVEGPPGTGKTTFITEMILQTLQQNSETRILLSSQTHVAIDNVLERIQSQNPQLKLIRIGDRARVSQGVHSLLLEEQMEKWREEAIAKGKRFIEDRSAQRNISIPKLELATQFKEFKSILLQL